MRDKPIAAWLERIWGDGLPAGRDPWLSAVRDILERDDDTGRAVGLVVQGDGLQADAIVELLHYVPSDVLQRLPLPIQFRDRVAGRAVEQPT